MLCNRICVNYSRQKTAQIFCGSLNDSSNAFFKVQILRSILQKRGICLSLFKATISWRVCSFWRWNTSLRWALARIFRKIYFGDLCTLKYPTTEVCRCRGHLTPGTRPQILQFTILPGWKLEISKSTLKQRHLILFGTIRVIFLFCHQDLWTFEAFIGKAAPWAT